MSRQPYIVGIVGGSASGKTSFLSELVARLPAGACCAVTQDNYYRPIHEQTRDPNGYANFDLPTAIQRERFHADLCSLVRGETITLSEFTFNHLDRPGRRITLMPAKVIVVEGLFLFHYPEIRALLDLRIFVEANEAVCRERRLQRDVTERGYTSDQTLYQWEQHVLPAYRAFVLPYRDEAHLIIGNHASYEKGLEVVTHHVLARLTHDDAPG